MAGPGELLAEPGDRQRDRHDQLELGGAELGLEAPVGELGEHVLGLVNGLQRLRVDEDQLLLEADARAAAAREARRCRTA